MEPEFVDKCSILRGAMRELGSQVKSLMDDDVFKNETDGVRDEGEMRANIMLAYRHMEDARMRLGKAIQAYDGGVSVYDK